MLGGSTPPGPPHMHFTVELNVDYGRKLNLSLKAAHQDLRAPRRGLSVAAPLFCRLFLMHHSASAALAAEEAPKSCVGGRRPGLKSLL